MYTATRAILFKALSGIHAGSGADLGIVDLPIQREKHTGFPKIESSGIKGCLREEFEKLQKNNKVEHDLVKIMFGPEEKPGSDTKHSGAIAFTDARILLFPVRSARGVFAYATCPLVLKRLAEDFAMAKIPQPEEINLDNINESNRALVAGESLRIPGSDKVVLEEYTYVTDVSEAVKKLANQIAKWLGKPDDEYLLKNLIVLPDNEFTDFTQNATEIITRIKISADTGTVETGALFTEELLPTETVMYSLVMASSIFLPQDERGGPTVKAAEISGDEAEYLLGVFESNLPGYIQIGGDATIGKGLTAVCVVKGGG